ncbi:MAG: protease modulator HflC [Chromatiales bacterium]|jgi:membrane protease subunit HflC
MQSPKLLFAVVVVLIAGIGIYASTFVVNQWETALKLKFGEIVDADYQPGLHFKWPIVNNVIKFDSRIQTLDSRPERFITAEKKFVVVDSYAKWRISDVAQYYRSTGGNAANTARLLSERINTALRDEFGIRTIQEVVSGERAEIMELLSKNADQQAGALGVEIVDVRVKKIDFPPEVSSSVFDRMRTERERVARELRAQGAEEAEKIRAEAERERTEILASAYRDAEVIRGEGEAISAETYAKAFNQNADFYSFWRSLTAYRDVFGQGGDMMVLEPDSEFFRFLNQKQ